MSGLVILNPIGRRKRKSKRSPSRRRRKMTAKQLKFFGPRKSRKAAAALRANPRRDPVAKRKRRSRKHSHKRRRFSFLKNPIRHRRRFRRNPIEGVGRGFVGDTFAPAAIGAMGAVGADILLGYFPMRPFGGAFGQPLMRIIAALGVGWIVGAVTKNERAGSEAAAGGVVVALYSLFRPMIASSFPVRMARYVPMRGMGARGGRMRMRGMRGLARGPRGMYGPPNKQRLALKGVGGLAAQRIRRMGAFVNPARTSGPARRTMMRYVATN